VVGADGFGYAQDEGRHVKIPQVGRVVIESDVEIGANTTIDRGAMEETRIGEGTKVDNLVQIAHNVRTGPDCILVAQSGISGSTTLGRSVILAGQSGAVGHIRIGDRVRIGAKSAVTKSLPDGAFVTGHPAQPHKAWLKERAMAGRLEELLDRVKELERRLSELRAEEGNA
jgi:UDP-3-O-[3-hydroxymyristoyl] glucosamine N-acyltransferase